MIRSRYLKEGEFVPLSFDLIFKKVFGDENDLRPLKTLLKVVLNIKAKDIRILNNEILVENLTVKNTTVDLIVSLEDGTKIGIEMNRISNDAVITRNLVYMFRIMSNSLKHNDNYIEIDKHIQINFDMTGYHENPIDKYLLLNEKNVRDILTKKLEIYRVDVSYFTQKCYNQDVGKLEYKDKFIGLIGINNENIASNIVRGDVILGDIKKKIEDCNKEDNLLLEYDYRKYHDAISDYEITRRVTEEVTNKVTEEVTQQVTQQLTQQFLEKEQKNKEKLISNMLKEGIDINAISRISGLSIEEINKIN